MVETQGYRLGKEGGVFWFGTNIVTTTSVGDSRFSSWGCALQPEKNRSKNQKNFGSYYYQNHGKDATTSHFRNPYTTNNAKG
jgi:hypothetical protein